MHTLKLKISVHIFQYGVKHLFVKTVFLCFQSPKYLVNKYKVTTLKS